MPAFSDSYDTEDGVTIDYEIAGEGPPLVLLHSGMMSRDDMRVQIDHFSAKYQVIALDSREQGRSSSSPEGISYELMVSDVIGLLDHLKINRASMFGQSDGGITALLSAHVHPRRINKLIIHGAVFNYQAYDEDTVNAWLTSTWDEDDPAAHDTSRFPGMSIASYLLGRSDLSGFEEHIQEMTRMWATSPNLTVEDLAKIKVPTLVIVGDHFDMPPSSHY